MKYTIHITDTPKTDSELVAAVLAVLQLPGAPVTAKANAIRDLASFSARLDQFKAGSFGPHHDRPFVIVGPDIPDPGYDTIGIDR